MTTILRHLRLREAERAFLLEVTDGMEIWAEVCARIVNERTP